MKLSEQENGIYVENETNKHLKIVLMSNWFKYGQQTLEVQLMTNISDYSILLT